MARWEPDAAGRLREAALDLYVAQGYEQTTVAEIAERAGVTARTYFRHYADKREVLFAGAEQLEQRMVAALLGAPPDAAPLTAVAAALDAAAEMFGGNHAFSRRRQSVIAANPELRERELIKMARLADALTCGAGQPRGRRRRGPARRGGGHRCVPDRLRAVGRRPAHRRPRRRAARVAGSAAWADGG